MRDRRAADSPVSTTSVSATRTRLSTAAVERSSDARYWTKMALVRLSNRSIETAPKSESV